MAGAGHVLVVVVLAHVDVLNVVVGHHNAHGRAGGALVLHHAGEDVDPVPLLAGGVQGGLAGLALVQLRLNVLGGDADAGGHAVHNGQKAAVQLLGDVGALAEAAGVRFAAGGHAEHLAESIACHNDYAPLFIFWPIRKRGMPVS